MSDETVDQAGQDPERVGFCQDCGKPLTRETVRTVGSRVFCDPCLTTRMSAGTAYGATPPPPNAGGPAAVPPPYPYTEPFPPMGGNDPSPVLAAILGFIPGVGAMYNGQYAKGLAHIVIYVVLQSLANHNGVMGLLVAGFVFYQVFEAYHTAKARREGRPLPDPFGLNNIGQHVGVHFQAARTAGAPPNPAGYTGYVPPQAVVTPPPEPGAPPVWGSVSAAPPVSAYTQPPPPAWETPAWTPPPPPAAAQEWASAPGYDPVAAPTPAPVRPSNVPAAAVWLIGLGVVFMLINFLPEWRHDLSDVFPFLLMAFAGWLFVRRMLFTGGVTPADGEGEAYVSRAVCALRAPAILFTVGVLWCLQEFDVVRMGRTWPVLVIVIGALLLLERSVGSRAVPLAPPVVPGSNAASGDGKGL
jgi:TM2 domain-containing membrane protein YozV